MSNYNQSLIQRGSITFWFDQSSINNWHLPKQNTKKRGRPRQYSDAAIQCMLVLKYVYRLPFRQTEGLVRSLIACMGLPIQAISYTQLCRRQKTVKLPKLPKSHGPLVVAIDGSGLKLYGEGEWKVRQHGYSKRRNWRKIHLGIDVETQQVVMHKLTDNHTSEHKQLDDLLGSYHGKIAQVLTDAGYDYHNSYEVIQSHGASPIIAPIVNPAHPKKSLKKLRPDKPRDAYHWAQEQIGVKAWKRAVGYHRRSLVETCFYRFKQALGDKLMARNMQSQQVEIAIKSYILNKMTETGIPSTC